jgi:hypothetical protein
MTATQTVSGKPWQEFSTVEDTLVETKTSASAPVFSKHPSIPSDSRANLLSFKRFANCVGFLIGGATLGHFFGVFFAVVGGCLGLAAFVYVDKKKKKLGLWR